MNFLLSLLDSIRFELGRLLQLVCGLKDSNNDVCQLTLIALAAIVLVVGADVVVDRQRR